MACGSLGECPTRKCMLRCLECCSQVIFKGFNKNTCVCMYVHTHMYKYIYIEKTRAKTQRNRQQLVMST